MFNKAPKAPAAEPYRVFGIAGNSMNDKGFQKHFGKKNSAAGSKGERILFEKLRNSRNGWLPADTALFCSLIVPGKQSDIDFAIVRGNKILLIDAKMYRQNGGFFWNMGKARDFMNRNFGRYKNSSGEEVHLSKSMNMARDILSRELPGFTVESVVVFVTDPQNRNAKVPNTTFLKYPGEIKVLNQNTAPRYIAKFLRGTERTIDTVNAEKYLERITQ